jgi:phosphoglycolate phosphatase
MISGVNYDDLVDSLHLKNQKLGTIEHPFALIDTEIICDRYAAYSREERIDLFMPAFRAFDRERRRRLSLYPGAEDLLNYCKSFGVRVIALSEAHVPAVHSRLELLDVEKFFRIIYCVRPRGFEKEGRFDRIKRKLDSQYRLIDFGLKKPDPMFISSVMREQSLRRSNAIYVGDSLDRDIRIANDAGIQSAWAAYGVRHNEKNAEFLVRLSHWTADEVEAYKARARLREAVPNFELSQSLEELIPILRGAKAA